MNIILILKYEANQTDWKASFAPKKPICSDISYGRKAK